MGLAYVSRGVDASTRFWAVAALLFTAGFLAACSGTYPQQTVAANRFAQQISEAERRGSPVVITDIRTSRPNTAGGVDVHIDFVVASDRPLKYLHFQVEPYNRVADQVMSTIGRRGSIRLTATGPFAYGATNHGRYWSNVWYNHSIHCAAFTGVTIEFMDGDSQGYSGQRLRHVFSRNNINFCGNNHVSGSLKEPLNQ